MGEVELCCISVEGHLDLVRKRRWFGILVIHL